jgi:hypothetical protein
MPWADNCSVGRVRSTDVLADCGYDMIMKMIEFQCEFVVSLLEKWGA